VAGVFLSLFVAAAVPSPLYAIYQAKWNFSSTVLTGVFAVYAVVVLVTLLIFGSASDYLGRRFVIIAALLFNVAACAVFLLARGVGLLFAARALQGVAVGAASGPLGAALIDRQASGGEIGALVTSAAPNLGLGVGALGASALIQYEPSPTRLVWWLVLGVSVISILGVLCVRESSVRRPSSANLFLPRMSVPLEARSAFAASVPCFVAVWALSGLYLSLGPSLAGQLFGSPRHLWGGIVICLLCGFAALAAVAFRSSTPRVAVLFGCFVLIAGAAVTLASVVTMTAVTFLVGTTLAGIGFGPAYLGAFRASVALAPPESRAGFIATIYIVTYLGFSVPTLVAGLATSRFGLHGTAIVYAAFVGVLVVMTTGSVLFRRDIYSEAR